MTQQSGGAAVAPALPRPLLRGRIHAAAAVGAVLVTVALCWRSRNDLPRLVSMLIFGLSMIELYTVSAVYHMGHWRPQVQRVLRSVDHANIFVLIAGTYTPLCFNVLTDWVRTAIKRAGRAAPRSRSSRRRRRCRR